MSQSHEGFRGSIAELLGYYSEESAVSGSNRLAGLKPIEVTDGNW